MSLGDSVYNDARWPFRLLLLLQLTWGDRSIHAFTTQSRATEFDPNSFVAVSPLPEEGTGCGLGDDFGFIVRTPQSGFNPDKLLVELLGGGACWDFATCNATEEGWTGGISTKYWQSADMITGMKNMLGLPDTIPGCNIMPGMLKGVQDFCVAGHPFANFSFVHVPYCTGDLHWGDTRRTYTGPDGGQTTVDHIGARNVQSVLRWVRRNWASPREVMVFGGSAGGFAASLWAAHVADIFPAARVAALSDSGLHLPSPSAPSTAMSSRLLRNWNAVSPLTRLPWSTVLTEAASTTGKVGYADMVTEWVRHYRGRWQHGSLVRLAVMPV